MTQCHHLENDNVCGKPAFILDRHGGGMVCPEHAPGWTIPGGQVDNKVTPTVKAM